MSRRKVHPMGGSSDLLYSLTEPKPGDLIEIHRTMYNHWGIYIGDDDIVHLILDGASGDTSTRFSSSEEIAVIKKELLAEVAGSDSWQVNNRSDSIWNPLPIDKIIKKAKEKIGCKVHYNVLNANCEHFVNSLRYDIGISFQVIKTACIIGLTAIINPLVGVALGAAYFFNSFSSVSSSMRSTSMRSTSVNSTSVNSTSVNSTSVNSTSVKSPAKQT